MSIKYKKHNWIVMTEDTVTQFDNIGLPKFEKISLNIMRVFTESERKKSHEDRIRNGRCIISYKELIKKLRV